MRRVVISGMGTVSPVGNTVEQAWQALKEGKSGIESIKSFDASEYKVQIAAEVKDFDPLLYIEKSEVRKNDLYTRYAIAAATQAMQDSGIEGTIEPERLGVYIGSGIGGIQTTVEQHTVLASGKTKLTPFFIPMMIANAAAGVVAIRYNAQGPTLPVVTACATSSHTVGEAFRAIKHGYADAILAGGSEAAICPLSVAGFIGCMALTTNPDPLTACTPFDARRSGFVIGDGAAVLMLEEYERAKARGAHIYAEVAGYGNTTDAYHITAPQPEAVGISKAISLAVKEADITVGKRTYVNAHGTSTQLNDKTETLGYKNALGGAAYEVAISSTKSMTGHMLGAAGGMEAIVCAKALQTGIAPPTIGYEVADPECDLNYIPNKAIEREFETAISTSLGFGGHNACLVFKKYEG